MNTQIYFKKSNTKDIKSTKPGTSPKQTRKTLMIILILAVAVTSCSTETDTKSNVNIGSEGVEFAKTLSAQYPFRKAYSTEEKASSALIFKTLEEIGYDPVITEFTVKNNKSQNIILKIPGTGFTLTESSNSGNNSAGSVNKSDNSASSGQIEIKRQVIIGAHYDTLPGVTDKSKYPEFDGIQDNSSGTGALISIARELKKQRYGYDIVIIFFGAGHDGFAGADNYAKSMTPKEIADTDAMYCIESIYAGDKLYAHSGLNSLETGKKYIKRRKLYELSDVAIENVIDLRFNESDLDVDVNNDGKKDVYREITVNKSDYSVFDILKIPCVYIESFDYFASSQAGQIESKNPFFAETKGKIKGTKFDSYKALNPILDKDRLENRIKNTAFLIIKALEKGIYR